MTRRTGRFANGRPLIAVVVLSVIFAALSCENAPVLPEDLIDGGPLTPIDPLPTGDGPGDPHDDQGPQDPVEELPGDPVAEASTPAPKVIATVFRGGLHHELLP